MTYLTALLLGTIYGFLFGVIPVAGAATALITVYSFISYFQADPYLLVVFTTAIVVASSIGDSFSSIVLNIPGAGGSAATMVDGFPMAQRGESARALGAALSTSTVNGLLWGLLVFVFLPYYSTVVLAFGIPEMLVFMVMAFTSVVFITNQYWIRGIIALGIGILMGLVGQDPITGSERFTLGWQYLGGGVQLAPVMAGVLAFPELYDAYMNRKGSISVINAPLDNWVQIWQGFKDSWKYKWDGLRGGLIGGVIGAIPGIGGNIADWMAYGQTVAANPKEEFGNGNVRGVIGCEGANNAQKATSYVPTILFGIPGAPFEVIIMSLFMLVGLELGSPELLVDHTFIHTVTSSYMWSMAFSFLIALFFIRYAVNITRIPFQYYFWPIMGLLLWASVQYTGMWHDYVFFGIMCVVGMIMKHFKLSRAAFIIGLVMADRIESVSLQFLTLYNFGDLFNRPITLSILAVTFGMVIYGIWFNKSRVNYI
jgi:TctA family transporter